jgi:nucleoid-associated protein YgaU
MDVSIPGDFGNNTKQKGVDVIKAGGELSDKLKDWYEHNLDYWNGSYGIKGNGKIKVGQRARVGGKVFYIETVNQSFTVFGEWQTTLAVTRGQDEKATSPEKPSITIPGITAGANKASTPQAAPPNNEKYTVLEGDTLWAIASKFYGDGSKTSDILKANPQITDPNLIYTGDVLIIPNPVRK